MFCVYICVLCTSYRPIVTLCCILALYGFYIFCYLFLHVLYNHRDLHGKRSVGQGCVLIKCCVNFITTLHYSGLELEQAVVRWNCLAAIYRLRWTTSRSTSGQCTQCWRYAGQWNNVINLATVLVSILSDVTSRWSTSRTRYLLRNLC